MFFQRFLALVLCRPQLLFAAFVLAIVLIVWGEIGGGVCLPSSQLKQNFLPTIDSRTSVACENSAGEGFARHSVTTNFAETPYKNFIVISRAYPLGIGVVALDPSQWAMGFGSALNYYAFCSSFIADNEETGEGGIRTLGSLLGYGALAKRCFRPLSHLTKSKARISQAILDFQFVICIRGHRLRRLLAISSELPIADC
jgi:hypothetical protein